MRVSSFCVCEYLFELFASYFSVILIPQILLFRSFLNLYNSLLYGSFKVAKVSVKKWFGRKTRNIKDYIFSLFVQLVNQAFANWWCFNEIKPELNRSRRRMEVTREVVFNQGSTQYGASNFVWCKGVRTEPSSSHLTILSNRARLFNRQIRSKNNSPKTHFAAARPKLKLLTRLVETWTWQFRTCGGRP